jgi:hypothetical protein
MSTDTDLKAILKRYQNNPILPLELSRITSLLNKTSDFSMELLKPFYSCDPLLCATLIRLGWQATQKKDNHPFSPEHASNILGLEVIKPFFLKMPTHITSPLSKEVTWLLSCSLLAAELIKNIAEISIFKRNKTPLYWAAMAHLLPETLLWHLNQKAMWVIFSERIHTFHPHHESIQKNEAFEKKHWGFFLKEWNTLMAQEWHMSVLNQKTFETSSLYPSKKLIHYMQANEQNENSDQKISREECLNIKNKFNTESGLIVTLNGLSKVLMANWFPNTYSHYFSFIKKIYGISETHLKSAIHLSLRNISTQMIGSSLFIPMNCHHLMKDSPPYPEYFIRQNQTQIKKSISENAVKTEKKKTIKNVFTIKSLLNQLLHQPESFQNSTKIIMASFEAIMQLGFFRVCFMQVDWKNKQVISKISLTCPNMATLSKIEPNFNFTHPTPLNKFLMSKGFLIFNDEKHQNIWKKLPIAIQTQKIKRFALFSIKPNQRVKALIYIDTPHLSYFDDERKTNPLKMILNAMHHALSHHAVRSQKTNVSS